MIIRSLCGALGSASSGSLPAILASIGLRRRGLGSSGARRHDGLVPAVSRHYVRADLLAGCAEAVRLASGAECFEGGEWPRAGIRDGVAGRMLAPPPVASRAEVDHLRSREPPRLELA